jgi:hypothetical protein
LFEKLKIATDNIIDVMNDLKKINEDTILISENLSDTVKKTVTEILTVTQTLVDVVSENQKKQEEFFTQIITLQEDHLAKIISDQDRIFNKILAHLDIWNEKVQNVFETIANNITEQNNKLAESINLFKDIQIEWLAQIKEQIMALDDALNRKLNVIFTDTTAILTNIKEHQTNLFEKLTQQIEINNNEIQKFYEQHYEKFQNILSNITSKIEELTQNIDNNINTTNNKLEEAFNYFTKELEAIKNIYNEMQSYPEKIRNKWKDYLDKFDETDKILNNIFINIKENTDTHMRNIANFFIRIDESYAKSLGILTKAITEMDDTFKECNKTTEDFNNIINEFYDIFNEVKNITNNTNFFNTIDNIDKSNNKLSHELKQINKSLDDNMPMIHRDFSDLKMQIQIYLENHATNKYKVNLEKIPK